MVHAKFKAWFRAVDGCLIERRQDLLAVMVATVARESTYLVGDPGLGKSHLLNMLFKGYDGKTFTALMTKFTQPEQVFGPLRLSQLPNDRYVRNVSNYLPAAEMAFVDEIPRTSPAVLGTLLTIFNEREFENDGIRDRVPLRSFHTAANSWPHGEGHAESAALFDRFLIRREIRPVSDANVESLAFGQLPTVTQKYVNVDDLDAAFAESQAVTWGEPARKAWRDIVAKLKKAGIEPSQRRLRKSVGIAQAAAWLRQGPGGVVEPCDLLVLCDVLWRTPERVEIDKAGEIIKLICDPIGAQLGELATQSTAALNRAEELLESARDSKRSLPSDYYAETKKASECAERLRELPGGNGRAKALLDEIAERLGDLKRRCVKEFSAG